MIKTKKDALDVINALGEGEMIKLYPDGRYGNLLVCITREGCREFQNGEIGSVGKENLDTVASTLYKYRKSFNEITKTTYTFY